MVDKHLTDFKEEKYSAYLKNYTEIKYVGDDIDETSTDTECAKYCIANKCDFITADKEAYDKIFTGLKEVKSIEITLILEKELANNASPVYSLSFRTE